MVERVVMGEMVERVARAICDQEAGTPGTDCACNSGTCSRLSVKLAACAAIAAMREPTGEMKDAGAETYGLGNSVIGPAGAALVGQPTKAYQAMIDKALED